MYAPFGDLPVAMRLRSTTHLFAAGIFAGLVFLSNPHGQAADFSSVQRQANGDLSLRLPVPTGQTWRIDASTNFQAWEPLATSRSVAGVISHADSAAPYFTSRFYRATQVTGTNIVTGDHLVTSAGDAIIHPINHASFVMQWNGLMIYNDPVGGVTPYSGLAKADLILVSHIHSDHYDAGTLDSVRGTTARIVAPQGVYNSMSTALKSVTTVLANGASTTVAGIGIDAVPAYNSNHPQGTGNGYVLTIGGKRIYISGDTGDIAETRALMNIDVAFVCMNVPFTMSVAQATANVRAFRPHVVYPYHYRNQDNTLSNLETFRQQVGRDLGIEVRARTWY
jgi:L-ascorbate metabolism protein UlaG (beta-lactamase superfamily)